MSTTAMSSIDCTGWAEKTLAVTDFLINLSKTWCETHDEIHAYIPCILWSLNFYRQHCEQRNAPVFNLLRGHFEVFRPAGATCCTDGGEIWHGTPCQISPHWCNDKGIGPPQLKFLLGFDHNVEYKRHAGAYPLPVFTKFTEFVPRFRIR